MKKTSKNQQIEALRGFAILLIVIYHLFDRYQQIYFNRDIKWMNFWGTFGVSIFFIISGYFMINPNSEKISFISAIKRFTFKNLFRIWPCYFLCVTLTFILTNFGGLPERTVDVKSYIVNLFFINTILEKPYVDGAHWYIHVLLIMVIFTLILQLSNLHRKPIIYILWIIVTFVVGRKYNTNETYWLGGPFVGCLCTGISIRFLQHEAYAVESVHQSNDTISSWFAVALIAVLVTFFYRGIVCAIEIVVISPIFWKCSRMEMPIFNSRILTFMGMISYPLYLIHQNIGFLIEYKCMMLAEDYNIIFAFIAFIFVIIISIILFYGFERPIGNKLRIFSDKILK